MTKRTTPGDPARWRGHVPMAPEGEQSAGGTGGAPPAAAQTPASTPAGETQASTPTAGQAEPPAQTPAPAKASGGKSAEELLAAIEAERAALAAERAAYATEVQALRSFREADLAAERRAAVRAMVLAVPMTDEQIDRFVPKVDPRTDAGRVALAQFREQNSAFFVGPAPAPVVDPKKVIEDIVGGANNVNRRLFGGRAAESMIAPPRKTDWS